MRLRWLSALVGIPVFLGICFWGAVPFSIGILGLAAVGLSEMLRTYRAKGLTPNPVLAVLGLAGPGLGVIASPWELFADYTLQKGLFVVLSTGLFLGFVWEVARAARTGEPRAGQNVGYGLLCGVYVSLFGGLVWLRHWPGRVEAGVFPRLEVGVMLVLLCAFCVWMTDSFALFTGRSLGRRKLAPTLSPNKTMEGSAGGFVAGALTGLLAGWLLLGSPWGGLFVGLIAGVFAQIGDLFKSALKREAGVKDFGTLIPGHGGVLDRFDSLLFVAPLVILLLVILLPAPVH